MSISVCSIFKVRLFTDFHKNDRNGRSYGYANMSKAGIFCTSPESWLGIPSLSKPSSALVCTQMSAADAILKVLQKNPQLLRVILRSQKIIDLEYSVNCRFIYKCPLIS